MTIAFNAHHSITLENSLPHGSSNIPTEISEMRNLLIINKTNVRITWNMRREKITDKILRDLHPVSISILNKRANDG